MRLSNEIDESDWGDATKAVRAGFERSSFGEHAEPIMTTSSYVFANAAEAAARFCGDEPGLIYSRFTNPTVQVFERRLASMEGTEACVGTASGMAATAALIFGTLQQGEHLIATRNMFGSTVNLFKKYLPRFGIEVSWVDSFEPQEWAKLVTPKTRYFYLETPTNPLTEIADIAALAEVAHDKGVQLVVDNCFCTPALQKPIALGADIVIHSATKYLDGQGRCVGGAVAGSAALIEELIGYMRSAGPSMSPFNAWVFLKGLETLSLRMHQHCGNASTLAHWLAQQPGVARVHYPGLQSHPQHALAARQQSDFGGILSFEMAGGKAAAWRLIDATRLCSITGNLGDTRTTITHPATTTHGRMSEADRTAVGINDGLVRIAVGLEDVDDIQHDLERALMA
jgi:O-succinylhomoserine sulfhydrylase